MQLSPALDPQSPVPLYRQLFDYLGGLVRTGRLGRGEKLPATRELAGSLGLNRATIASAYELLEAEGLISSHVGRGSFVIAGPGEVRGGLDWRALVERPAGVLPSPAVPGMPDGGISFAASRPSEDLFPLEEVRATCLEAIGCGDLSVILQLGSPKGYEPLRQRLLEAARAEGAAGPGDDLIVTNGCQQGLDLIARVLVRPRETVAVEDPVYPGLRNVLAQAGARLVGIPAGDAGMEVEGLERTLLRERVKVLVVTSSFQNPTGGTLDLRARRELLRAARAAGTVVVENDIYAALRYGGEPLDSLKKLDESGNAVLLRSFSKIAFPGLRVGWVIGPKILVDRLAEAKQVADLHTDQLSQAVLLRFLDSGRLEEHRKRAIAAGAERLGAALEACAAFLPKGTRFTHPQGGMNLWVELPPPLDAGELLPRAAREGVVYLPGKYFTVSRFLPGGLRLSFAGLPPGEIRKGIAILGEIFSRELERIEGARREPAPVIV